MHATQTFSDAEKAKKMSDLYELLAFKLEL